MSIKSGPIYGKYGRIITLPDSENKKELVKDFYMDLKFESNKKELVKDFLNQIDEKY